MKKLFFTLIAVMVLGLFASYGLACPPGQECGDNTAAGTYQANAAGSDYDYSSTRWRGNWNDGGEAYAGGAAGGTLETYGNGGYSMEPVYDDVLVSKLYRKWEPGKWEWHWYGWKYEEGHWTYKTFPPTANPHGWEFVSNNYERQIVGYERVNNPTGQGGFITGTATPKAWAWSKDYGRTSMAGAGAVFEGSAFSMGYAFGREGCPEWVSSDLFISGEVYQRNWAGETGYSAGGISGGNESGASFTAGDFDLDVGNGFAFDMNYVSAKAITKGMTQVSIDPYGNYRSISGFTENFAQVMPGCGATLYESSVYGSGGLSGIIGNGPSYGAGDVSFSYNGNTYGAGSANLNATVITGPNSTTVTVSGSSTAYGN
jgi:hypothetical protein